MIRLLKHKRSSLQLNNKGLSLVEVIVAALLLSIIVVSALQLFVMAARTNKVNRENNNAETLANNLMESVKAGQLLGAAKETYDINTDEEKHDFFKFGVSSAAFVKSDADSDSYSPLTYVIDDNKKIYSIHPSSSKRYVYKLSGLQEGAGSKTYSAEIIFDADYTWQFKDGEDVEVKSLNNNATYSYDALNERNSVLINPVISGFYFDDEYVNGEAGVRASNIEYKDQLYSEEYQRQREIFEAALDAASEEDKDSIRWEDYAPDESAYSPDSLDTLINRSRRILNISVEKDGDGYRVKSSFSYGIYDNTGSQQLILDDFECEPLISNSKVKSFVERDGDATFKSINIYLFYVPFPYISGVGIDGYKSFNDYKDKNRTEGITFSLNQTGSFKEGIVIDNQTSGADKVRINLFIVGQEKKDTTDNPTGELSVSYKEDGLSIAGSNYIKYFSEWPINVTEKSNSYAKEKSVDQYSIIKVTVRIIDDKGTATESDDEVLREMTSSFQNTVKEIVEDIETE